MSHEISERRLSRYLLTVKGNFVTFQQRKFHGNIIDPSSEKRHNPEDGFLHIKGKSIPNIISV
jgi:hypothetical protein